MQNINNKNSEEYMADEKVKSVKTFNMKKAVDKGSKWIFLLSALIAVFSLLLIMGFVFYKGLRPFFAEGYSFVDFIIGTDWYPSSSKFGILPMIIATILGTIGALLIGGYIDTHYTREATIIDVVSDEVVVIDEFGNECPYDFKNILFRRYLCADNTTNGDVFDDMGN